MNCSRMQRSVPDLWINDLNFRRKAAVEMHLSLCPACRKWYVIWQNIRDLGWEQIRLPQRLNWQPFNQALEHEIRHHIQTE
jgi:predicted anti-sigma-YlaC factor YlaD